MDYRLLTAELQQRLDRDTDRASELELALARKEEESDEAVKVGARQGAVMGGWGRARICAVYEEADEAVKVGARALPCAVLV